MGRRRKEEAGVVDVEELIAADRTLAGLDDHRRVEPPAELAAQFAAVARALQAEPTEEQTLARIAELAVTVIDGCDHAGITVVRRGRPETVAASDEVPARVDALQYQTRQGPCLDAITDESTYRSHDLVTELRWPQFAQQAAERTGIRSMLAYRLFTHEDTLGALNLYSAEPKAFEDDVLPIGAVFAAHAAMAFAQAREREQINHLEQAVASNRRIGIAIGILMVQRRIGSDAAFALLRAASQLSNRKLRDIAEAVVRTGEIPPGARGAHQCPPDGHDVGG
jgi:transcriptional regulator with GAF, ATPase, and Fis domain